MNNVWTFSNIAVVQCINPKIYQVYKDDPNVLTNDIRDLTKICWDYFDISHYMKVHIFMTHTGVKNKDRLKPNTFMKSLLHNVFAISDNLLVLHFNKKSKFYKEFQTELSSFLIAHPRFEKYVYLDTSDYTLFASGDQYYKFNSNSTKQPTIYTKARKFDIDKKYNNKIEYFGGEPYVRI